MTDPSTPFCGPAPLAADLLWAWNGDLFLLTGLAIFACCARLSAQKLPFWLGWAAVAIAFVSPLCALSVALFSARALHHLLLITIAAPLLGLAFPRFLARLPLQGIVVVLLGSLLLWHMPQIYSAAWRQPALYWLLQLALLAPAIAFWAQLLRLTAAGLLLGPLAALAGVTGGMGMIGAILTFAPRALYPEHELGAAYYGMMALEDQQLAGLLMWVPGFVPMLVMGFYMLRKAWAEAAAPRAGPTL